MRKIIKLKNQNEEISQYEGQEKNFNVKKKPRDIQDKIRISSSHKIGVSEEKIKKKERKKEER